MLSIHETKSNLRSVWLYIAWINYNVLNKEKKTANVTMNTNIMSFQVNKNISHKHNT